MTKKNGQNAQLAGTQRGTLTKRELEHQYKLSLMRDCQIYGKSLEDSKLYFNSKGYSLSKSQSTELKKELKSSKMAENWFSKEALFVMEESHMISVEAGRKMEADLVFEYWKCDDINKKIRIIAQWESLQMTMTKMFSATPMVQELMEVHRRQEDEENKTAEPEKTEKRM